MVRVITLLVGLPAVIAAGLGAEDSLGFNLVESLGAMFLIAGSAVVAAG